MNAPEPVMLLQSEAPKQRKVMLVCRNGEIAPLRPGTVLLPSDVAQKRMENFWQGIFPPKPVNLPRLIELTVVFRHMAVLPWGVVRDAEVKGPEVLDWMRIPALPPQPTADASLRHCFGALSARGFDVLQVPLPEGRGHYGLVPLSCDQIEITSQALDMKRSSQNCFGYRWVWHTLSPEEQQAVFKGNLAPA